MSEKPVLAERQAPKPIADSFKSALRRVGGMKTGRDAIWVLENVDQQYRVTANNCFWLALGKSPEVLKKTVAYFKGKIRLAASRGDIYAVTGDDYRFIQNLT